MLPLLQTISFFSLSRGVLSPGHICEQARSSGYRSVGITDLNNLYGLPDFLAACGESGLRPLIGAEVDDETCSALLYADGDEGYAALCRVISEKNTGKRFRLGEALRKRRACLAVVTDSRELHACLSGRGHVYYRLEKIRRLPAWVREGRIPALVVPPVAFASADDYRTHRLLAAVGGTTTLTRLDQEQLLSESARFRTPEKVAEEYEVFEDALRTTVEFAESLRPVTRTGKTVMPCFHRELPAVDLLRKKTFAGAEQRYGTLTPKVIKRIEYELELITGKGFADYFLIVEDIVRQSPRTCGRGSGAASIVAYALGITNVDPVRYNLMFERFLNPDRKDPPDIDVDFAWDERDEILDYVFRTYGEKHTAMVATHQTFGARMAIREVARIHGLTEHEISIVTKKIPPFADLQSSACSLEKLLRQWPGLKGNPLDHPWPDILKDAGRLIGLPRGIGTHCGGVLITPGPIRSEAPVQYSAKGYPIVQWEKEGVEAMGLVKIDLLGNRSLAVIRDAIASVKREGGSFDERSWDPQSDPATMRLLAEGKTMGVFYVESPAMRLLQRKSGKGDFEHLVIHSSIIRPAANRYIREYLKRLRGEPYVPLHPVLGETLAETFGIMVYQEDVARVAMALAGFSAGEADNLRKIMAKKSPGATLEDFHDRFLTGASARGVDRDTAAKVWGMMESFRGYSFCKPHSASYVQVSFQAAWLKVHYPAHFMAAVLSNYGGFYTTQAYVSEALRLGCGIVPPDVNGSGVRYRAREMTIQVGLCQIKGLSRGAMETIVSERCGNGDFATIENLLDRTGIDERDAEQLILAGAADSLDAEASRPRLFWRMRRHFRSENRGAVPALGNLSQRQYLRRQYLSLGFLTECHPISLLCSMSRRPGSRARDIDRLVGGSVSLFGWCVTSRTVSTETGEAMEFVTFEDETGTFETVFFPEVYRRYSVILSRQMAFLIRGKVTEEFGVAVVEVQTIERVKQSLW